MIQIPGAFCELNEAGDRIRVFFQYDPQQKEAVKAIPGSRFVGRDKAGPDGPHWTLPADIDAARRLRDVFGRQLVLGDAVRAWGRQASRLERNLKSLAIADDAELIRVPEVAPIIMRVIAGEPIPEFGLSKKHPLSRKREPRPYQRADISMMSQTNTINANQPGTGKTLEAIAALVEAGLDDGVHLVAAPRTSLVNTWQVEIERLLGHEVYTAETPKERRQQIERGLKAAAKGKTAWLLVIYDDIRLKRGPKKDPPPGANWAKTEEHRLAYEAALDDLLFARKDYKGNLYLFSSELHKRLLTQKYRGFIVDEFHKSGLNDIKNLFTLGADIIDADRVYPMSGTPMGGKPIRLYPILRRIEPKKFSSKWKWAGEWLEIEDNGYGKKIGGIKKGKDDQFYDYHARYMVRRLKKEALPGLPPKVIEIIPTPMTPKQAKQYAKFDKDAEVKIEGTGGSRTIIGNCILAEYSRLKQFANGYCELNAKGEVVPTEDSGKLPVLLDKLDEFGIRKHDPEPAARAIVASQSKRMVEMVSPWLTKNGIDNDMLTGDTKDSKPIIDRFHSDDERPYIIVMTTQTGGVSLNLEEASSVHILDESWNPDDDEQLEDRGDRGERTTPLVCLYYRTTGTVQEYIAEVAEGKKLTNRNVLDVYRQIKKMKEHGEG